MSVHPVWDNAEQTVVRHIFQHRWTVDELRLSANQAWAMMNSVTHTVHAILDGTEGDTLPSGGLLAQTNRIATHRPDNAGIIVIVTNSSFIVAVAGAFRKIYGRFHPNLRYYVVSSLDEARILCYDQLAGDTVATPVQPTTREAE